MFSYILIGIILLANLSLGLLVYFRNPKNKINELFGILVFWVIVWIAANFLENEISNPDLATLFLRLDFASGAIVAYFFLLFCFDFQEIHFFSSSKRELFVFLPSIVFAVLSFSDLIVNQIGIRLDGGVDFKIGTLFPLYAIYLGIFMASACIDLILKFKKLRGVARVQTLYVLLGFSLSASIALVMNLFLQPLVPVKIFRIGTYGILFFVGFTTYAIIKYRFMDIRIAIKRSTVYLLSLIIAVVLGLALMYLAIHYSSDISLRIIAPIALILSVILFGPIKKGLEIIANKYFFTALYSQQEALRALSQKLATTIDLDKLVGDIVKLTTKNFGLDKAAVLIKEPDTTIYKIENIVGFKKENGLSLVKDNFLTQHLQKTAKPVVYEELSLMIKDAREKGKKEKLEKLKDNMKHIEASICLPLLAKGKLDGIIILGKKISGDAYSKEDLEMLETLANQTSMAIENSRLYDQIKDLSKNLEKKVQEQTKDLKQANINLQKLLQMKTEFLTTVSHQLRTPLTPIRGLLSMLKERTYSEKEKQEMLDKVTISAERLNNITNDMLDAMELEGGYLEFKFEPVDLTEVIQEVIETLKPNYDKKKLYLKFQKPDELLPKIQVDPRYIKQLLLNLIDNAEKYTREGGTTISIDKEDKQIIIKISDTGCGLDKEDKEKLFQKFSRGKEADRYYTAGSGLGLFIVKRIIDEHQGAIEVESQGKDKGSTFIVKLPIVQYG